MRVPVQDQFWTTRTNAIAATQRAGVSVYGGGRAGTIIVINGVPHRLSRKLNTQMLDMRYSWQALSKMKEAT